MDSELRFISALLNGNKAEQLEFWGKQLPLSLYPLREAEVHWIYRFREKHGRFPSARAYEARFDEKCPDVTDPLAATLEPLKTQAAFAQLKNIIDNTSMMFEEKKDPTDIVDFFRTSAAKLQSLDTDYVDEDMTNTQLALQRYREQLKLRNVKGSFIESPWGRMNRLLNFSRPGEQVIIAARPSLGKTWLLLYWMNYLGSLGIPTLVISKEMPSAQIADRLTAIRFGLDWEKFRSLSLDINEQVAWKIAALKAAKHPYPILVSGEETLDGTGMEQVYAKVQKCKPRVFGVDGAYLLNVSKTVAKSASDVERYTVVSRGLKRMAKVTSTVSFAVIQMNRQAETKKGVAKGGMTTLYGADAWGQDADTLIELAGERGQNERVVCVHKSRETNIGDFPINFRLSPRPDLSEKPSLSSGSALGSLPFKLLK